MERLFASLKSAAGMTLAAGFLIFAGVSAVHSCPASFTEYYGDGNKAKHCSYIGTDSDGSCLYRCRLVTVGSADESNEGSDGDYAN